jgi:hypothetical protein
MGIGNVGGMRRAISVSGKPSAVSVTVAYIAPEAPKDGIMSGTLAVFAADVTAAVVVAVFETGEAS